MRTRTGVILVLALVSGLLAAYLAINFLGGEDGEKEAAGVPGEGVDVVVAARAMDVGTVLSPEDVKLVKWPSRAVPQGYSGELSEVVGRGLLFPVSQNEPLLSNKLARSEAGGGLPIVIPDGKRAVSVAVDQIIGVAGFVLPGTRVDIIATLSQSGRSGELESEIILQNIEVLSAGQTYQRQVQGEPMTVSVVTLVVTPEQAEMLTLATSDGLIQLALRNPLDLAEVETEGTTRSSLLGSGAPVRQATPRPTPRPRPRREPFSVEVYRGPERSTATMDTTSGGDK